LNFGLHLVAWDWLGGTLRKKTRLYGEDLFVGHQDVAPQPAAEPEPEPEPGRRQGDEGAAAPAASKKHD